MINNNKPKVYSDLRDKPCVIPLACYFPRTPYKKSPWAGMLEAQKKKVGK